ncbi:MAG: hypothetical protein HQL42_08730 [Alphaproteobacteria bacterium]|nr:hypothetical protein [Alphaproteobacteria bacterium]
MADFISCVHDVAPIISAIDPDLGDMFPPGFTDLYEVYSYRNASRILATACRDDFAEIIRTLMTFRIKTEEIVKSGGNKSQIAKNMEDLLHPQGWNETRVKGDLYIRRVVSYKEGKEIKAGKNRGAVKFVGKTREDLSVVRGFIDGHKIDFIKNRVAFDLEWNSKDQTFDRDLYAARTFYECGIVSAGVLLTRSALLAPLFAEIQPRVDIKDFKSKFGASTTWMGKLKYRLDAGRGGGCPILALGIKPALVDDFDEWKAAHPIIRQADFDIAEAVADAMPDDED